MDLQFKRLSEISSADIIELNNNPDVLRHMPLGRPDFDEAKCSAWVAEKESQWLLNGYGPWAFWVNQKFAGWGGLQQEQGDADLALVLHPDYWGLGKAIFDEIVRRAFQEMGLGSVTVLLAPSRTRIKGILRIGFRRDGEVEVDGIRFARYRLLASTRACIQRR
ncbi:GNAT family N-acetyltransferase [Pseudomonas donghuensis]|uniref:GNAT family N-acetyltransferase n=1 Tax=Pseudomonas donghuensis TaxID=1163398 RepID=A0AAP0SIS6_9PSED|nr:GNAT family N-acetyltransferase [Pseudomonas donghuensis]MDF9892856.1 RimJ/RimL family protein N-acetyltransferase [Pseudomonas vranovensis]KDO00863.1 GNAT family N-acetyltransferase [Pseudomonas donghuensis]MBF4210271.1 N-acetyltransferase [Pseudomonas donghuensis]MCP6694126.1 GNAT family N-acetyltransferase [Pseudomonas donghuensis]MCP6696408.1 GNAT family N-acetyltransferase [Pseudomonas donghuensis]